MQILYSRSLSLGENNLRSSGEANGQGKKVISERQGKSAFRNSFRRRGTRLSRQLLRPLGAHFIKKMKILIPFDGSKCAENALRDLIKAKSSERILEVLVVVSDVWMPESTEEIFRARAARRRKLEMSGKYSYAPARLKLEEEQLLCREASERLSSKFASSKIHVETLPGMSLISSEILERVAAWGADLIILGSSDESAATHSPRPGTAIARVAGEAFCAVRIAGGRDTWQFKEKKSEENLSRKILAPILSFQKQRQQPQQLQSVKRRAEVLSYG